MKTRIIIILCLVAGAASPAQYFTNSLPSVSPTAYMVNWLCPKQACPGRLVAQRSLHPGKQSGAGITHRCFTCETRATNQIAYPLLVKPKPGAIKKKK